MFNSNAAIEAMEVKMKHLFAAIFIFALLFSLGAQEKRAITFEDFFSMKRIGGLAVSPDGKTAAFSLTAPDIQKNNFKTDIWLLKLSDNSLRQFTNAEESSSGPVWSPDGRWLYFSRGGQIWKQAVDGGEAQQVTDLATGAGGAVLSVDGSQMLFVSDVYPDCETEECNKEKMEAAENSKVKARLIDRLLYRHWNHWRDGKYSHVFLADIEGSAIKDLTPGAYDTPPISLGSGHDYAFSPDGKEVCFVRNTDPIVAASTNNDLFITSLTGGKITRLTAGKGNDNHPSYSRDGRYIAYASMERAGFEADRLRLMLYDRKNGTHRELTKGFNLSVYDFIWHPNGKEIYFKTPEKGFYNLYKVNINSSKIEPVLGKHYIGAFRFAGPNTLVMTIQTAAMPNEIFLYDLKSKKLRQITFINKKLLSQLELPTLEEFWFTGAKGDKVQGFILKPPFFDAAKKYPAVELIHGGPQGAWGDDFHYRWNYQMFAAPGYVVFMINFHGSKGYGQNFCDAVSKDWGGAPYEDILKGTEYVLNTYDFIDKDRVGAAGASYGGFMINWIAGADNPFKCLVSHDGVYEQVSMYGATEELWFPEWEFNGKPWEKGSLYQKWNPANRAGNFKTPMLVIHGERDFRVPYTQGLQLFTALQRQGVKSKLLFFPDEDHFVRKPQNARLWWETVHGWFAEFLK